MRNVANVEVLPVANVANSNVAKANEGGVGRVEQFIGNWDWVLATLAQWQH